MDGIKVLVVLAVAAFDLAVVPGRKRPDLLVADAELSLSNKMRLWTYLI